LRLSAVAPFGSRAVRQPRPLAGAPFGSRAVRARPSAARKNKEAGFRRPPCSL